MCLYAQLVQTKNKQCKSTIILQCYHPHLSDFCSRPRLTQPIYNASWCCQTLFSLLLKVSVVQLVPADITISGKLSHTFTIQPSRSLKIAPFDRSYATYYWYKFYLLLCHSCTIFELFDVFVQNCN